MGIRQIMSTSAGTGAEKVRPGTSYAHVQTRFAEHGSQRSLPPLVCYKKQSHSRNKNVCDQKEMLCAETPAQHATQKIPPQQ